MPSMLPSGILTREGLCHELILDDAPPGTQEYIMLRQDSIQSAELKKKESPFRAKCHEIFCCPLKQVHHKEHTEPEACKCGRKSFLGPPVIALKEENGELAEHITVPEKVIYVLLDLLPAALGANNEEKSSALKSQAGSTTLKKLVSNCCKLEAMYNQRGVECNSCVHKDTGEDYLEEENPNLSNYHEIVSIYDVCQVAMA
ncbi:hypothetical protein MG293_005367 [Ovis ammon polii]|uniref:Uncharacterized protein n=1 Tax=Ovis ammon polii TaxID=230172 RepID=A0AAD4UH21_OVIAM|nr:hypothetical protein MG293_005367 [Ovis ammon polii]